MKDEVDPAFNNDQYWVIFPFHQFQDSGTKVEDAGMQKLPLGKGSAEKVVVSYSAEAGGYRPGDTWTLFVGPDKRVKEFVYRSKHEVVIMTWAGNKMAGVVRKNSVDQEIRLCNNVTQAHRILLILKAD